MKPFSPLLFDSTRNRGKQFLNELISTFYFRGFIVRLLRSGSATRRCGRRRKRRRQRRLHARRCRERVQLVCMPVLTRSKWTSRSWALWPRARMSVIEWSTQPSMPSPPTASNSDLHFKPFPSCENLSRITCHLRPRWWCLCDMAFTAFYYLSSLSHALNIDTTTDDDGVTSKGKNVCRCWLPRAHNWSDPRKHFSFMTKSLLRR